VPFCLFFAVRSAPNLRDGPAGQSGTVARNEGEGPLLPVPATTYPFILHLELNTAVGRRPSAQSYTSQCQPTPLTSMEDHSQRLKNLPRLLALPRVHLLPSSWHAVDRGLEGFLVTQTPFQRKIYASGTHPKSHNFASIKQLVHVKASPQSGYHSLKSFGQTFHLEKRWKLVREMGSGAYGVVMSVQIQPFVFFLHFWCPPCNQKIYLLYIHFFFLDLFKFFFSNTRYCQLSRRRDLKRDRCNKDGHAYLLKDIARETRTARAYTPSTSQQP
jgi:hypothetical protein